MGLQLPKCIGLCVFTLILCSLDGPVLSAQMKQGTKMQRYTASIRLYQPDPELRERVPDVGIFTAHIRAVQARMAEWEKRVHPAAHGLFITVGLKAGRRSQVWCEAVDGEIATSALNDLQSLLRAVPPPEVRGPVAYSLQVRLSGEDIAPPQPTESDGKGFPDIPKPWKELATKQGRPLKVPDEVFRVLWPD